MVYVREIILTIIVTNRHKSEKLMLILPTPFRLRKGATVRRAVRSLQIIPHFLLGVNRRFLRTADFLSVPLALADKM